MRNDTVKSTAGSGFLGGAASGLLLSIGTTAFEFTKVSFVWNFELDEKRLLI